MSEIDTVAAAIEDAQETARKVNALHAMKKLEEHTRSAPDDARLFMALMEHAANAGDHPRAFDYADKAARLPDKNTPAVAHRISNCMQELGRANEAVIMLEGIRKDYPGIFNQAMLTILSSSLVTAGRPDKAVHVFEEILDKDGDLGVLWTAYAGAINANAKSMSEGDIKARIDRITRIIEASTDEGEVADRRLFARGEMYEAVKDYPAALEDFLDAKERADRRIDEDANGRIACAQAVTAFSTEKWVNAVHENCAIDSDRPVFIMGMPRSGTSLTEQILSRHDQVNAAGENTMPFNYLFSVTGQPVGTNMPSRMAKFTAPFLKDGMSHYLDLLHRWDPTSLRVTNKTPGVFHAMGVLHGVMPGARTIVTDRDPLDSVIGVFRRYLSEGGYGYALDMGKIANAIRAKEIYLEHWAELFGERMMRVSLEGMSADPAPVLDEVQEFLGVPREETAKLITPTSSDRSVRTFSSNQVREGLRDPRSEWMRAYRDLLPPYLHDRIMANLP